jgi:D-glycerate 3-kinase
MEGWCMGFSAISSHELEERWEESVGGEMKKWCAVEHVREVNETLKGYEALWAFFDVFVQVRFPSFPLLPPLLPSLTN